jgi:hypothetical protein
MFSAANKPIVLSVIMMSVVMPNVVAPFYSQIGVMLRPFFWLALPVRGFSIMILRFGQKIKSDHYFGKSHDLINLVSTDNINTIHIDINLNKLIFHQNFVKYLWL